MNTDGPGTAGTSRENRLRSALRRRGYTLHKSRARLSGDNRGDYQILNKNGGIVAGERLDLDLDGVESFLKEEIAEYVHASKPSGFASPDHSRAEYLRGPDRRPPGPLAVRREAPRARQWPCGSTQMAGAVAKSPTCRTRTGPHPRL